MGYIAHDVVIMTTNDARPGGLPDVEGFRASLPPEWRPLVVGPVPSLKNGYVTYAFLPDGSKDGWDVDVQGDEYRAAFVALFAQRYEDGSSWDDGVSVRFGEDLTRGGMRRWCRASGVATR